MSTLRRKISVAEDLRSVVRTMKAVAASNIDQYENSVAALVDYYRTVELGLSVCLRNSKSETNTEKSTTIVGAIVFGSDQGLIGRFNEVVADYTGQRMTEISRQSSPVRPPELKIWAVGERIRLQLETSELPLRGVFNLPGSVEAITPLVQELTRQVLSEITADNTSGRPAELYLFYNRPSSGSTYGPVDLQLLPLNQKWQESLTSLKWPSGNLPEIIASLEVIPTANSSSATTLRAFVGEYVFLTIFRACAESLASENASRLSAMQRADKNIEQLLLNLRGTFHRFRQSDIDAELFDVVASFEILNNPK